MKTKFTFPMLQERLDQNQEGRVRRRARKFNYRVCKSRAWKHVPNLDNFGQYMLRDASTNFVVLGGRYDASLDEIEAFLND